VPRIGSLRRVGVRAQAGMPVLLKGNGAAGNH
jgi:hypothetical protein